MLYEVLNIKRTRDGYLDADVKARQAKVKEPTSDMIRMIDNSENADEAIRDKSFG